MGFAVSPRRQRLAGVLTLGGFWTIEVALFVCPRVFRGDGPAIVCLGWGGVGTAAGVAQEEAVCEMKVQGSKVVRCLSERVM